MLNGCVTDSFENLSPYLSDFRSDCGGAHIVAPLSCNNIESLSVYRIVSQSPFSIFTRITGIDYVYDLPYVNKHYGIENSTRKLRLPNGQQVNDQIYITNLGTSPEFFILGENIEKNGVYVNFAESSVGLTWTGTIWKVSYWGKITNLPATTEYISLVRYLDGTQSGVVYNANLRLLGITNFVLLPKIAPADSDPLDNDIQAPELGLATNGRYYYVRYDIPALGVTGPVSTSTTLVPVTDDSRFNYHEFTVSSETNGNIPLDLSALSQWLRLEYKRSSIFSIPSVRDYLMVKAFQMSYIDSESGKRDRLPLLSTTVSSVYWMKTLGGAPLIEYADFEINQDGNVYPSVDGNIFNNLEVIVHYA